MVVNLFAKRNSTTVLYTIREIRQEFLSILVTTQPAIEIAPQGRSAAAPTEVGASACAD
jgi:hypothetical protein